MTMEENLKLRSKMRELSTQIVGEVEHGECFYDLEMLSEFCDLLDEMKRVASRYYNSNRKEIEELDDYELIECSECGEEKEVEKGTWALDKGMCEQCYCAYQGG